MTHPPYPELIAIFCRAGRQKESEREKKMRNSGGHKRIQYQSGMVETA